MKKQVITFHYHLTDKDGATLDSSKGQNPLIFLEGSGQIIPGLEGQITSLGKGDKKNIHVKAKDAYGEYDASLVYTVTKDKFPSDQPIKVGDMFQVGNDAEYRVVTVIEIAEAGVTLDGNHPLAGQDLNFEIEITDKRDATDEEIAHGHVHGAGGHHHH